MRLLGAPKRLQAGVGYGVSATIHEITELFIPERVPGSADEAEPARRFNIYVRTLVVGLAVVCACSGLQKKASAQPESNPERRLIEKRIANEEAQAEYYREQTKKLSEPAKTKTFWDNIKDNPASALGVLGAALVAFVALISFIFNYRATLRNQQDTQFYEALKRFGDTDSPAGRSSAAGILAQMSMRRVGFRRRKRPYYLTAFNQLTAGCTWRRALRFFRRRRRILLAVDFDGHLCPRVDARRQRVCGRPGLFERAGVADESFFDIFGTAGEFYVGINPDYLLHCHRRYPIHPPAGRKRVAL